MVAKAANFACEISACVIKMSAPIPQRLKDQALINMGVYPNSEENLISFAKDYCESIRSVDVMGVWAVPDYDWLVNTYCPNAYYTRLWGLEPYHFSSPWSKHLKGKTVLVIHPFEKSILSNFKNRDKLFTNPDVLPEFNLLTIKAEQNLSNNNSNYFDCLNRTKEKISKMKFDIAIVGCGASGLPLSSHLKTELRKTVIHMGG